MSKRVLSTIHTRWIGGFFLIGVCGFLVLHFFDSVWMPTTDMALHYALVARISEHWQLPTNDDPSLGEMNVVPRYAHRLAAVFGAWLGSPLAGMQFVALLSLATLWSGFAFIFLSLPRRALWIAFGTLAALLLINRLFIRLELFGNELVGNYFYPQLVGQAAAIVLIAVVLWMERARISHVPGYLVLAGSVPIIQQFHLLPALEVLAALTLLVAVNIFDLRNEHRWTVFFVGLFAILASLLLTVYSSAFATIVAISQTHGLLKLTYTPNLSALAIESTIVIVLSAFLVLQWMRLDPTEARMNGLTLKYIGVFGMAVGGLCLLQIIMLKLGYGSEYACKKYAFGLNTSIVLDVALLPIVLIPRLRTFLSNFQGGSSGLSMMVLQCTLPGLFVLLAFFTTLPPLSAKYTGFSDAIVVERLVKEYEVSASEGVPSKQGYAIGLFPHLGVGFDYVISLGVLKSPRANADQLMNDILSGRLPSKPRSIGRIFTREGSKPWDIRECRLDTISDGIVILDGRCVLTKLEALHP